jgi:hypothetical protein
MAGILIILVVVRGKTAEHVLVFKKKRRKEVLITKVEPENHWRLKDETKPCNGSTARAVAKRDGFGILHFLCDVLKYLW